MNWLELGILFIVLILVGWAFYEGFIRHRKDPCHGCPYAKNCTSSCEKKKL